MNSNRQIKKYTFAQLPHQWTGRRKSKRPLHFKMSTHLVLRLKELLPPLFAPRDQKLRHLIYTLAQKYNIRLYRLVLNHSHLHSVMLLPDRHSYVSFIRELTSALTQYFTKSLNVFCFQFRQIFKSRPFTRATPWGRAYKILLQYMNKNEIESGLIQNERSQTTLCACGDSSSQTPARQPGCMPAQLQL